jgi:hypothetical protein
VPLKYSKALKHLKLKKRAFLKFSETLADEYFWVENKNLSGEKGLHGRLATTYAISAVIKHKLQLSMAQNVM